MTKQERVKVFFEDSRGKIWFLINIFFTAMYLTWRIFFTIPFEYGMISIVAGISLLLVEVLGMVEAVVHFANMYKVRDYKLPDVKGMEWPDVDVFIATYSEEPALLYKTINGCKYMKYPDKSKVHIYLCDDNRRAEMRQLASKMCVSYLDRENNEGAKAGNLNNALAHSSSAYILTLDADMIPKSDFLLKTIPYFMDAERRNRGRKEEEQIRLGFLQTPQSFYNPDLFQFHLFSENRIPNEQDYFYKDIQVARTRTNSVIYGGSNTVLAREALEKIGGFYTKAITEDFATGILIQKAGYISLGIGESLAVGMSATDLQGLLQQRIRWGRGVIATGRKMHIYTCKDLSFAQKMNFWASIWYWYAPLKRLIYMMSPLIYAAFGFMVLKCTLPQVLLFWLPMYISSNISLKILSCNIRNTKWTSIYENVLFPFMLLPILLETFGISLKKFMVTNKAGSSNKKGYHIEYMIPFLILIVLSVIGLMNCISTMFDSGMVDPIVVVFWIVYNLYLLVMSLFFVDGRTHYRRSERAAVELSCEVRQDDYHFKTVTRDISENGVSFYLDKPCYFREGEGLNIGVSSDRYRAELSCKVVYVRQEQNRWIYSAKILDHMDTYEEYLQLIYDRETGLPHEIKKDSGSFEDLKINIRKRVASPFFEKRQYPRVLTEAKDVPYIVLGEDERRQTCGTVYMKDFNFCYVNIEDEDVPERIILFPQEAYKMECQLKEKLFSGGKLYSVVNIVEIQKQKSVMEQLIERLVEMNQDALQRQEESERNRRAQEKEKRKQKEFDEKNYV